LFRESFARVALRQTEYDVAPGYGDFGSGAIKVPPRPTTVGTLLALIAATALSTGMLDDAVDSYGRGRRHLRRKTRLDPPGPDAARESDALAELGRHDEALAVHADILSRLGRDQGPGDLRRCWQSSLVESEVPATPAMSPAPSAASRPPRRRRSLEPRSCG